MGFFKPHVRYGGCYDEGVEMELIPTQIQAVLIFSVDQT